MKITEITENKKDYLPLLLLGDEQEDMIDRYLDKGKMYALYDNGIAEESRTHDGLKCHFCPSQRYLHKEIRPVCPCASALI